MQIKLMRNESAETLEEGKYTELVEGQQPKLHKVA